MEDCIDLASNNSDTENLGHNLKLTKSDYNINLKKSNNNINSSKSGSRIKLKEKIPNTDKKWEKIVIYYLARLKGLCDWRKSNNDTINQKPTKHLQRCTSEDIESRIIDKVIPKPFICYKETNISGKKCDIGCYIAAGYGEGKEQAIKIILRSLKYGVMTGILIKRENSYQISPEYLYENQHVVSSSPERNEDTRKNKKENAKSLSRRHRSIKNLKRNVKNKRVNNDLNKKKLNTSRKSNNRRGMKRKLLSKQSSIIKKKRSKKTKSPYLLRRTCDGYNSNTSSQSPLSKKNKRQSDTNVILSESSNINSSYQSSGSLTPLEDRNKKMEVKAKRPRPKIQKVITRVLPPKRTRTQSQSKSPSHHTDDEEVRDKPQKNKMKENKLINMFEMPRQRRYLDIMSLDSSSTSKSTVTLCTFCKDKEKNTKRPYRRY